jgi:agmatinase
VTDGVQDRDGLFGLTTTPAEAACVLIPVPFEATVSYAAGTAGGPQAILDASPQIDLFDLETGEPWKQGIAMLPIPAEVRGWSDAARALAEPVCEQEGPGDDPDLLARCEQVDAYGEQVNAWVREQAERWLDAGKLVGVVGGDHSVPFSLIAACAQRHPGVGVLHLDAHADQRQAYEGFTWSHASIFRNVIERVPNVATVVGVGYRDLCAEEHALLEDEPRLVPFYDPWLQRRLQEGVPWAELSAQIVAALPERVYVSYDIDGLDPALCPHTGTPVPGGLSFTQATSLLRDIVQSGRRIVGFDLCEVAPDPRGESEWDANVGMRLLYKLAGFGLMSRAT